MVRLTPPTNSENTTLGLLMVDPHVLRCFLLPSLPEAPSLHRSYPASQVPVWGSTNKESGLFDSSWFLPQQHFVPRPGLSRQLAKISITPRRAAKSRMEGASL
jgi:hypothetical protein